MDYYSAVCDREQQQRNENGLIAEADLQLSAYKQERQDFGPGLLCACGMMQAQDCNCPF